MNNKADKYSLRLYDEELIRFSLSKDEIGFLHADVLSVNEKYRALFPLDLTLTSDGVVEWLNHRVIPKNRAFVEEILANYGLELDDTQGIIDVCKGLSLNDSYWIVPEGFSGKFADYNLYENRFSEILSLVAYTGNAGEKDVLSTSPELTTGGMLRKAWRHIDGDGIYLYKGGTSGFSNTGNEPYSEYYAYQIAQKMNLNAVSYDLEHWKGILASKCKLFTDINTAYVPIGRIVTHGGIRACLDYYASLGPEALQQLKDMLVFDSVIYNTDRHFGNFGVLRDNHTGKILGPAPIFDNGLSLFCYATPEKLSDLDNYAKTLSNPYNISYSRLCRGLMEKRQRDKLRALIGFSFQRHPSLNLPEERLKAIERKVQNRVAELLSLTREKKKDRSGPEL